MDSEAANYDPEATINAWCVYIGCTSPNAWNFCSTCNWPCSLSYPDQEPLDDCCEGQRTVPNPPKERRGGHTKRHIKSIESGKRLYTGQRKFRRRKK